ncbi:MAG TPA: Ppx/GppA phosphatase family protein [Polyangiales bacterium]|nr:Ppx/GppA phosphatase family protein [Polyangiales bacterium]
MNVAAVDIGTNSVRLLILAADGSTLAREMVITRLGQGVDQTGALHVDAIARTTTVLRSYRALLEKHRVQRVRATATSAARDASNRDLFFSEAEAALGTRPELISGAEEAALSFQGATTGLAQELGPFLVVDIGGGSTEFVLGTTEPEALISVALGCVRMTERCIHSDPPSAAELDACAQATRDALVEVVRTVPVKRARLMVGLAGTITSLASLAHGATRYDPTITHHSRLQRNVVGKLCKRLASVPVEKRRTLLAEPKRAEVLVAGAVVLHTIMEELSVDALLVSESDILDGLAASIRR